MPQEPQAMTMLTLAMGAVLWVIMLVIIIKSEFHKKEHKKYWLIAMFILPPSCLLFPFIGMKQTK